MRGKKILNFFFCFDLTNASQSASAPLDAVRFLLFRGPSLLRYERHQSLVSPVFVSRPNPFTGRNKALQDSVRSSRRRSARCVAEHEYAYGRQLSVRHVEKNSEKDNRDTQLPHSLRLQLRPGSCPFRWLIARISFLVTMTKIFRESMTRLLPNNKRSSSNRPFSCANSSPNSHLPSKFWMARPSSRWTRVPSLWCNWSCLSSSFP